MMRCIISMVSDESSLTASVVQYSDGYSTKCGWSREAWPRMYQIICGVL